MKQNSERSQIDKNLFEHSLRVVALRRCNYMFFGSDSGEAEMYSLNGNCKLNGIDLENWLRYVSSFTNTLPTNRGKKLLPWMKTDFYSTSQYGRSLIIFEGQAR